MEKGLLHNFDMVHYIVVPIPVMVPALAGTSDSRSNVPVPVSGVEEEKKTDTDADSGAGITSPVSMFCFGHPAFLSCIATQRTGKLIIFRCLSL